MKDITTFFRSIKVAVKSVFASADSDDDDTHLHEQATITVGNGYGFFVDKGLEDIIEAMFHWDCYTTNSCIDDFGSICIEFESYLTCRQFMKLALKNRNQINGGPEGFQRETMWDFLEEYGQLTLNFHEEEIFDPNEDDTVIGTGQLEESVNLRFKKELLEAFRQFVHEVLPVRPRKIVNGEHTDESRSGD